MAIAGWHRLPPGAQTLLPQECPPFCLEGQVCRWSQTCAQLLDYSTSNISIQMVKCPNFRAEPSPMAESTTCLLVLVMAFLAPCTPCSFSCCFSGGGHCYSWPCTCPHQRVPCKVSALLWVFPDLGNPPCVPQIPAPLWNMPRWTRADFFNK